jgi:putative transposase
LRRPIESGQYTSLLFTTRCSSIGVNVSHGSRGDCFDNAAIESFHASLKKDLIHRKSWPTQAEARTSVFEYIETFYNRRRRHSRLGMLSPVEYENRTGTSSHTLDGTSAASRRAHTTKNISTTTSTAAQAA